jgi:hypothetical protein
MNVTVRPAAGLAPSLIASDHAALNSPPSSGVAGNGVERPFKNTARSDKSALIPAGALRTAGIHA